MHILHIVYLLIENGYNDWSNSPVNVITKLRLMHNNITQNTHI